MNCKIKSSLCNFLKKEEKIVNKINDDMKEKPASGILELFTEIGSSFGAIIIFVLLSVFFGYEILIYLFPIYIVQVIIVEIIKVVVNRPRPASFIEDKNIFGLRASGGSFPSGHTSNAFTMAVLFANYFMLDTFGIAVLFVIASLIGISRIYLDKHYILDVIGGAIIGIIVANLGYSLLLSLW